MMLLNLPSARGALAALALMLAVPLASAAETYSIDVAHSNVRFSIRHLVSRTSGGFTDFSGTISYDPAQPAATTVEANIQVASIDTDNERRDQHLRGDDFFDAQQYPTITFRSTAAAAVDDTLKVTGDLTMHGTTQSVTLPVVVLGLGEHPRNGAPVAGFESQITLKRSDYGVDSWVDQAGVLGDEVRVQLTIEAIGQPPAE